MILHVIGNDKFAPQFIDFIHRYFPNQGHKISVLTYHNESYVKKFESNDVEIVYKTYSSLMHLAKDMKTAEFIVIHGLFSRFEMLLLCITRTVEKSYIALWGGDLHCYEHETRARLRLMSYILQHCRGITMELEADYLLAKKWYKTNASYFPCMLYYSNIVKVDASLENAYTEKKYSAIIQVGNSADPSNRHFEVLEKLKMFASESNQIVIPLSYGSLDYAKLVEKESIDIFGNNVKILKDFMPLDEYMALLKSVDVAVFAHRRQQGLGNIFTLLSMGKKIYLDPSTTVFRSLKDMGVSIYSINELGDIFEPLTKEQVVGNQKIIKDICSMERLIRDWNRIFNDSKHL